MRFTATFAGRGRKGHYKFLNVQGPQDLKLNRDHCWAHEGHNDLSGYRPGSEMELEASVKFYWGGKWTLTDIDVLQVMP